MSDDDRRAVRAITAILDRSGQLEASHPVVATEIITALRGHGWRPTNATRAPAWLRPGSQPLTEEQYHWFAEGARIALAEASERAAQTEGTHAATKGETPT